VDAAQVLPGCAHSAGEVELERVFRRVGVLG
jgi:hypothetical protein